MADVDMLELTLAKFYPHNIENKQVKVLIGYHDMKYENYQFYRGKTSEELVKQVMSAYNPKTIILRLANPDRIQTIPPLKKLTIEEYQDIEHEIVKGMNGRDIAIIASIDIGKLASSQQD